MRMQRGHRVSIGASLLLAIVSALGGSTVIAAGPSVTIETSPMDRATCAGFVSDFKAGASMYGTSDRARIASMTDTGCYYELRSETTAAMPLGVGAASAATTCRTTARTFGLYSLGVEIATARTDMYWCSNGTKAWHDEATHYEWCRVTTAPLWTGTSDWCGAQTNHQATISMGQDFHVAAYVTPWYNRYGWTRFTGSKSGSAGASTGFCCN